MLNGIIGDNLRQAKKSILLALAIEVSGRTKRQITREGDNVDRAIVTSIDHRIIERRIECKRHKTDAAVDCVHGSCLNDKRQMTAIIEQRAADKKIENEEKKR